MRIITKNDLKNASKRAKQAFCLQYAINCMVEWTDDSVVYGKMEDWRIPTHKDENDMLTDDCDGFMSTAMGLTFHMRGLEPSDEIKKDLKKNFGLDYDSLIINDHIPMDEVALVMAYVEPEESSVDGTPTRGGHAIYFLLDDERETAWVIDNRGINFTDKKVSSNEEADRINSSPMSTWIKEGYAEVYIVDVQEKIEKDQYLIVSAKTLGTDKYSMDWNSLVDSEKWNWIGEWIYKSQKIALDEGIL